MVLGTREQLLADPLIDIILNLTLPRAHVPISTAALNEGKHVYSEKPFASTVAEGKRLNVLAQERGVRLASAPDTTLGPNIQLARRLIEDGRIGRPLMASMSFVTPDRDWHPDPEFFYQPGAGPIFDEGPYFLSALVALLGPVAEVTARAATYRHELTVARGPRQGTRFPVEVPTSYVGGLVLRSGVLVSMLMSFDVRGTTMPPLEIYGEEGTLRLAFPGSYNGPVVCGRDHDHITEVIHPSWRTGTDEPRGIGVEELAHAIMTGRPSRLEGEFPLHVLETMEAIVTAASSGRAQSISTSPPPPSLYPPGENPRNRSVSC
jgi:predicted dehydrogenase